MLSTIAPLEVVANIEEIFLKVLGQTFAIDWSENICMNARSNLKKWFFFSWRLGLINPLSVEQVLSLLSVIKFYNMVRLGVTWKGPETIEL